MIDLEKDVKEVEKELGIKNYGVLTPEEEWAIKNANDMANTLEVASSALLKRDTQLVVNDKKLLDPEAYADVKDKLVKKNKLNDGQSIRHGERRLRPDGLGYVDSGAEFLNFNPYHYFDNRYREIKKRGKGVDYEIVTDKLAIDAQESNSDQRPAVTSVVIGKVDGNWKVKEKRTVPMKEFVNDFTRRLENKSMRKIFHLVVNQEVSEVISDEVDFS